MIFTIASVGGSGTRSLYLALNAMDGVFCTHGSDFSEAEERFGTLPSDVSIVAKLSRINREHGVIAGNVHGYYGPDGREETIRSGGRAAALFRDPIERAISLTRLKILRANTDFFNACCLCFPSRRLQTARDMLAFMIMKRNKAAFRNFDKSLARMIAVLKKRNTRSVYRELFDSAELDDDTINNVSSKYFASVFIFDLINGAIADMKNHSFFDEAEKFYFEKHIKTEKIKDILEHVIGRKGIILDATNHANRRSAQLCRTQVIDRIEASGICIDDIIFSFIDLFERNYRLDIVHIYESIGYSLSPNRL